MTPMTTEQALKLFAAAFWQFDRRGRAFCVSCTHDAPNHADDCHNVQALATLTARIEKAEALAKADREYDEAREVWDSLEPSGIGEVDGRSEQDHEASGISVARKRRTAALAAYHATGEG